MEVKVKDIYKDIVLAAFAEGNYPKLGLRLTQVKHVSYNQENGYVSIDIELEFV